MLRDKMMYCKTCGANIAVSAKSCPYCGARNNVPLMKRNPAAGAVLLVLVCCIPLYVMIFMKVTGNNTSTDQPAQQVSSVQANEPSPIAISATELYAAYTENEVNADNQYKSKTLSVTGVVSNIGKDAITDAPCVSLESGSQFGLQPIQCFFPKSDEHSEVIAALTNGQTVTITGKCTGPFVVSVQLSECSISE